MTYDLSPILDHYGIDFDPSRSGNQQVACLFHEDRTPSASVHLDKGTYHCFSCGVGVNAVQLIMQKEGLSFGEAKRFHEGLVGKAGPSVQRESDSRGGYLPRREGHRPGGKGWKSPWASRRPGPSA